jgi:hypothetical protein
VTYHDRRRQQRLLLQKAALGVTASAVEGYLRDLGGASGLFQQHPGVVADYIGHRYVKRVDESMRALAMLEFEDGEKFLLWCPHRFIGYFPGTIDGSPPRTLQVWQKRNAYARALPDCPPRAAMLAELAPHESRLRDEEKARRLADAERKAKETVRSRQQTLPPAPTAAQIAMAAVAHATNPHREEPLLYQPLLQVWRDILPGQPLPPAAELRPMGTVGRELSAHWIRTNGSTEPWRLHLRRVASLLDGDSALHLGGEAVAVTVGNLLQRSVQAAVLARVRERDRTDTT